MRHKIVFRGKRVAFLHDDRLDAALRSLGSARIDRASFVEPYRGGWIANMEPSGGPWLFANGSANTPADLERLTPFSSRAGALSAERAWLDSGGLEAWV